MIRKYVCPNDLFEYTINNFFPQDPSSNPYGLGDGVKYYMLEVEDWTQPGTSKRRQTSKKSSAVVEPKEEPPVPLSAPPENEVEEETFHPARAPNSRHFPAARLGSNSTTPVAGPSSLSRLLAQAPVAPEQPPLDPTPYPPSPEPFPTRTPSPQPSAASPFPTASLPVTTAPGRPHPPHSSSPLRPGSRASRLSTSSRYSTPRIPAFGPGGPGGSPAKAIPTTAITAEDPGAGVFGSPTMTATTTAMTTTTATATAPPPAESAAGEGMASLLARRRTTSFHLPASGSPLAAPVPRQMASPAAGAFANLASWGTSFSRRRKAIPTPSQAPAPAQTAPAAKQDATAVSGGGSSGHTDAQKILQRF